MSKELIKEKLNKLGSSKEPFLFVLSYDLDKFYIEKLSEISSTIKFELNFKEHQKMLNCDILRLGMVVGKTETNLYQKETL